MRKRRGQRTKFLMALILSGFFWLQGPELGGIQVACGQNVFQNYTKPQPMPEFSLENLQGKRVDLRSHRGQVIFLNFWSTS